MQIGWMASGGIQFQIEVGPIAYERHLAGASFRTAERRAEIDAFAAADDKAKANPVIETGREGDRRDDALIVLSHVGGNDRQKMRTGMQTLAGVARTQSDELGALGIDERRPRCRSAQSIDR